MTLPPDFRPHRLRPPRYVRTRREAEAWPEPPDGQSREQYVKALLKAACRGAGSVPLNSDEESETGKCLSEAFTWQLDVLQWVAEPYLTQRQVAIVWLLYQHDLLIAEVARRLGVHHATVARDRHDALQTIIRIAWDDPDYQLPWRVYTSRPKPADWDEG